MIVPMVKGSSGKASALSIQAYGLVELLARVAGVLAFEVKPLRNAATRIRNVGSTRRLFRRVSHLEKEGQDSIGSIISRSGEYTAQQNVNGFGIATPGQQLTATWPQAATLDLPIPIASIRLFSDYRDVHFGGGAHERKLKDPR